jgi:hypothetical protein
VHRVEWPLPACEEGTTEMTFEQNPGVNFTNILRAALAPIFFCQKITKPNCNLRKATQNIFVQKDASKMLVKLIPGEGGGGALVADGQWLITSQ